MTEQIALGAWAPGQSLAVSGDLNGWGSSIDMTNNPTLTGDATNIYSIILPVNGAPGSTAGGGYKFRANGGWEDTSIGDNRNFIIAGGDQVLPVVYYEDRPVGPMTNANVTFKVDMTPQVITGGFTNGLSQVTASARYNGWGNGDLLTNDPSILGNGSNIYSGTYTVNDTVGDWQRFKFRADGGWESAAIFGVGGNKDRRFFVQGGDQVLPLVTYQDASLCDLLLQQTSVRFILQITNGTPDNAGVPFDKVNDQIFINGAFLLWPPWNTSLPEMTNNPVGSDFYETTLAVPVGNSRQLQFKFGLAGPNHGAVDNEAPQFQDHFAYVRTFGASYTMPILQFGTNFSATRVEAQFGNLTAGPPAGSIVPIKWLGLPCVTLQTKTAVDSGSWTDLPATDATSSTNWPNTGGQRYFRLQKRPLP
jgi:hypothetical protein